MQILPPGQVVKNLSSVFSSPGLFLETIYLDKDNQKSLLFMHPKEIIILDKKDSVFDFFKRVQEYVYSGYWAAGYFTYELGYLFEPSLEGLLGKKKIDFPLAWIGIFDKPQVFNHKDIVGKQACSKNLGCFSFNQGRYDMDFSEYQKALGKIKNQLKQGNTYQVNYTLKYKAGFKGDLTSMYLQLRKNQPTSYSGAINDGKRLIFSFSPELFFRINGRDIFVRPMKGTCKRGRSFAEDKEQEAFLGGDSKNRAENIMIVDLLRNDLGKISQDASVKTEKLFNVERYPSLFQMTSDVKGRLKDGINLFELFKAVFPSGSVTGAPKIRTMQIIDKTEKEPRSVYTGAIGYIAPYRRKACFNVAIRTLVFQNKKIEFGLGSGIVYDSVPRKEYSECLLKAGFLYKKARDFSLLETILWQKGVFKFLNLHLARLKRSAEFFGIKFSKKEAKAALYDKPSRFNSSKEYKVRILVDQRGRVNIQWSLLGETPEKIKVRVSCEPVLSQDTFLYHKTTNRDLYDRKLRETVEKGFFETIFVNEKGELTEGTRTNLFLSMAGTLYTPMLSSGLLPGVLREGLLNKGRAEEKILYPSQLKKAEKIFLGNSVRGLLEINDVFFEGK